MPRKRIIIQEDMKCPVCGSDQLIGHGTYWRINRHGDNPPKVRVQMMMCKECGKFFSSGEVQNQEVESV